MLNQINLIGRWTKSPELTHGNNGTEILNASLAVQDPFKKDHVDYVDVKAFKRTALNTAEFTDKGSKVAVVGKLQQERWEKDGQKRSKHVVVANQIVFLDEKQKEENQHPGMKAYEPQKQDNDGFPPEEDGGLPF